jgi:hypothetical protein
LPQFVATIKASGPPTGSLVKPTNISFSSIFPPPRPNQHASAANTSRADAVIQFLRRAVIRHVRRTRADVNLVRGRVRVHSAGPRARPCGAGMCDERSTTRGSARGASPQAIISRAFSPNTERHVSVSSGARSCATLAPLKPVSIPFAATPNPSGALPQAQHS